MKGLKVNIAILLLGIFIFPITFQSFHIVWHHSHGYQGNPGYDLAEGAAKPSQAELKTASLKDKPCPVCEYQFPINDLPKVTVFRSITPAVVSSLVESEIQLPFRQVFSINPPRAPPALHS